MKDRIVISVLIIIALALINLSNFQGVGYTHDSYYYLENSKVVEESGVWDYLSSHDPRQQLLTLVISQMNSVCREIALLNAVLFVLTVIIWIYATRKYFQTKNQWYVFGLMLVFGTPLLLTNSFLWTEPIFHFLLALLFLNHQRNSSHRLKRYIGYLILLPLLIFARKAGVLVILAVVIYEIWPLKLSLRLMFGILQLCAYCMVILQFYLISLGSVQIYFLWLKICGLNYSQSTDG